jgi:DNA polymerase
VAPATDEVIAALDALCEEVECCSACALGATRTKAVFGEGDAGADLMFVGEAPGYHEDQQGRPFVGQAGRLLEQLLASIGMTREQVYIANVLKSRPPNNRDPRPEEIEACRPYLLRQIEIIRPKVICTLGNFATKLLSGDPTGITKVHGRAQATEIAGHPLYLYPIFHPAAALYTPAMLTTLKEDFLRLPQLLAGAAPRAGEEAPAAERPAWRPPEHLRRDVVPSASAPPSSARPTGAPTLEDRAREALGATPIDDEPGPAQPEPERPEHGTIAAAAFESSAPGSASLQEADDESVPFGPADAAAPARPEPPASEPRSTPGRGASGPSPDGPAPAPAGPPAEPEQLGLF